MIIPTDKYKYASVILFGIALAVSQAVFADTIRTKDGKPISGEIKSVSPSAVAIEVNGNSLTVAAEQIASVQFDSEPAQLSGVRMAYIGSRLDDVLNICGQIDLTQVINPHVKQEIAYYKAMAMAKIAMGSAIAADIEKAGNELVSFTKNNPDSFHAFEILEATGNLLLATTDKFSKSRPFFEKMLESPASEYKHKAEVALGTLDLMEKKPAEARKRFQNVVNSVKAAEPIFVQRQKSFALIGLGRCLINEKKYDEAITGLEKLSSESNPEDTQLQAATHLAIGDANLAAGKVKEAILAYLHIDVLYSTARTEHIKALIQLKNLWRQIQREDRARDVEATLKKYNIQ